MIYALWERLFKFNSISSYPFHQKQQGYKNPPVTVTACKETRWVSGDMIHPSFSLLKVKACLWLLFMPTPSIPAGFFEKAFNSQCHVHMCELPRACVHEVILPLHWHTLKYQILSVISSSKEGHSPDKDLLERSGILKKTSPTIDFGFRF